MLFKTVKTCCGVGVFLILALSKSWSSAPESTLPKSRVFTFRIQDEPETLDWNRAHTGVEAYILMNIMEGLVTFDSTVNVSPALAESWTLSPDGRTYTFKLRSGLKWSDGVPVTSKNFLYSWKRLLSPLTAASYAYLLYDIVGAEAYNKGKLQSFDNVGISTPDDLTFQVKLLTPVAHWIYIPAFWVTFPMRQDVVEKYGAGWETPGRMVNVGPYSLTAHDLDSKIIMKANPNYYGKRGNVEQIVALIIKDDIDALAQYEAGKLNFLTGLATVDLRRLQGRSDLKSFPYLKTGFLAFVTEKYPISNVKLRRAIAMAIDKEKLSERLHGGQKPATSFVPPPMKAYSKTIGLPFDPIKAKAELRASGLDSTGAITLDYLLPNWDKARSIAQFIQSELKKNLGIEVTLQALDNKSYRSQLDLHIFSLFDSSWIADFPADENFLSVFQSDSGNSRTTWKNELFDQALKKARQTQDPGKRVKLYLECQKMLIEEYAVIVPLYYEPNLALVDPHVTNYLLNPMDYLYLRTVDVIP